MSKVFYSTNEEDYWSREIVKDEKGIIHVMVDGVPHPITSEGEPLYPIKDFVLKEHTFYAFGTKICSMIQNDSSIKNIIRFCKSDGDYSIFKFIERETSSEELLSAFLGWSEYTTISKELYYALAKI